jgi:hypothetical protein
MDDGRVVESGSYSELMAAGRHLAALMATFNKEESRPKNPDAHTAFAETSTVVAPSPPSAAGTDAETLTEDEGREIGKVDMSAYAGYVRAAGWPRMLLVLSLFAVAPAMGVMLSYWLVVWTEDRLAWSQLEYVRVYAAISATAVSVVAFRQAVLAVGRRIIQMPLSTAVYFVWRITNAIY